MPSEPFNKVYGTHQDQCTVFKSATMPLKLCFSVREFPSDWKWEQGLPEL